MGRIDSMGEGPLPIDPSQSVDKLIVELKKKPSREKLEHIAKFLETAPHIDRVALKKLNHAITEMGKNLPSATLKPLTEKITTMINARTPFMLSNTIRSVIQSEREVKISNELENLPLTKAEHQALADVEDVIKEWKNEKDPFNKREAGKLYYSIYRELADKNPLFKVVLEKFHHLGIGGPPQETTKSIDELIKFIDNPKNKAHKNIAREMIEELLRAT
jgi:hypothetical protein